MLQGSHAFTSRPGKHMQSLKMTHKHIKIELQGSSLQTCDETDRQEQDFQCSTKSPLTMQTRGWSQRSAHLLWRKPWALIRKYSWEFMVGSWVPWKRFESCWLISRQKAILLQQRSPIRYHRQIHGLYLRITRFHGFQRFLNLAGAHDPKNKPHSICCKAGSLSSSQLSEFEQFKIKTWNKSWQGTALRVA